MDTFKINKNPTKYKVILESIIEQGHALKAIHNPQTWCLSALTFSLHLYDCAILFEKVRDRWKIHLPFADAWDVDFSLWKNSVWSAAIDINSFTSFNRYNNWKHLCATDINDFITKASECLNGNVPISEVLDFLQNKETELMEVVLNMAQSLSAILAEIDEISTTADKEQFVEYYENLMNVYLKENRDNPYPIKIGEDVISSEKWIASKTEKQRKKSIPSKLEAIKVCMFKDPVWMEVWEENVVYDQHYIDKEGIGREVFVKRKFIIDNSVPCCETMYNLFSSLALYTHLWEYLDQNKEAFDNLPDNRKDILNTIEALIDKGVWASFTDSNRMKTFIRQVLGIGQQPLHEDEERLSQVLWSLFEKRRGRESLRVTWQNMIGYFDDKGLFAHAGGSPALNEMFFGNQDNYSNIDRGRLESKAMNKDFKSILPLLEAYLPHKR